MSEDIRKMIDKVKNFKQFVNENMQDYYDSIRDLERENKIYPNNILVKDKFEELMNYFVYDRLKMNMDRKVKYDMVWDILEYMTIYSELTHSQQS